MSSASDPSVGPKSLKARQFFQTGNDAAQKANFDYAIQMYQEACKLEPAWLQSRQMLRGIERKKFANEPSKVGRMVGVRTQPIKMRARAFKAKNNWGHVLEVCEEVFVHNPWDVHAARDAAEAAEQLGHKELARWFIESVQAVANDIEFFKHAAHVFELNEVFDKAIAAWERVKKIRPGDEDANRQINALSASATIQRAGLGDAIHKQGGSSGPESARAAELDELKQPQLSPTERWEKEIQDNPAMVGPYLQYAEHLKFHGKLDDAQKLLARARKAVPDDPSLEKAHAEVQIARLQQAIAGWTRKSDAAPDDVSAKAKLEQLQTMLADYEIKEFQRRVKLEPGDLNLQYELGLRLASANQHRDAIAAFQQARASTTLRVQALHHAGLSFEAEGQLKLAERNYQDALKGLDAEDTANFLALHYHLGLVSELMGNTAAAEEHYNEVAAIDYNYLDVAQRLRGLS